VRAAGRKIPKTLSGIETLGVGTATADRLLLSRKIPKTLSGIETLLPQTESPPNKAAKYLKPYQGLKHNLVELHAVAYCIHPPQNT